MPLLATLAFARSPPAREGAHPDAGRAAHAEKAPPRRTDREKRRPAPPAAVRSSARPPLWPLCPAIPMSSTPTAPRTQRDGTGPSRTAPAPPFLTPSLLHLSLLRTGKVHGSLARAGKVRGQTPKVAKQDKKKTPKGRALKRLKYNRRFVNVGELEERERGVAAAVRRRRGGDRCPSLSPHTHVPLLFPPQSSARARNGGPTRSERAPNARERGWRCGRGRGPE